MAILARYMEKSPGLRKVSAAYRFEKGTRTAKKWRDDDRDGDWLQTSEMYQHKVVASATGYLIKSVNL